MTARNFLPEEELKIMIRRVGCNSPNISPDVFPIKAIVSNDENLLFALETPLTPPQKKRKTSQNISSPSSISLIGVDALEKQWTLDLEARVNVQRKKIRSAAEGLLRGGDWIVNEAGGTATPTSFYFVFEKRYYGLTVGHITEIGESIFCFAEADKVEYPISCGEDDGGAGGSYPMFEIGTVVLKSLTTDSLVFEIPNITAKIEVAPPKMLAAVSGIDRPIELSNPSDTPPRPKHGENLVSFGAQRRGAIGKVCCPAETTCGDFSRKGNISIVHTIDPNLSLTDIGDCGTIFAGVDGTPFYFHHCARTHAPKLSYQFSLSQVMACRTQLGAIVKSTRGDRSSNHSLVRLLMPLLWNATF